jgi:LacI family transcriptional regulator
MPIRLKDIALDLGVSVVTVSKVLRNHQDISPDTRDRVLTRMKELKYQPNWAARSLVTGKTYLMGLVVPDLVHPFFSQVAKGASGVLRKRGYSLIISSSEEDAELEKKEIEQMAGRNLDVLIIASAQRGAESFRHLDEQNKPYVLLDRRFRRLAANFVGTDEAIVGKMATEHLIENGCRLIAHVCGKYASPAVERAKGYRRTLANHGISVPDSFLICRTHGDDSGDLMGYEAMKVLLKLKPRPDGVFCYNDPTAMGAMMAILDNGLRIPQDIAIIGCGNVHYAAVLRVPLSSIDQNSEMMGAHAAKLALSLIEGKNRARSSKTVLLEPRLVARASSLRSAARAFHFTKE